MKQSSKSDNEFKFYLGLAVFYALVSENVQGMGFYLAMLISF